MSAGQELVLAELWREDGLNQTELGSRLGIRPPTVTKMLRRMERSGLIDRRSDADDARVLHVFLASRGVALRATVEARCAEVERRTFRALTPSQLSALRELLGRLGE